MWKNEEEARKQIKGLVAEYYHEFKEDKKGFKEGDRINYSDIIKVFCLAYGQRIITNFLNIYNGIDS